jgi:hypothetical protein
MWSVTMLTIWLTICLRRRPSGCVLLFVVLVLMIGATAPAAFAQDPSASQSGLLPEPGFITKTIDRLDGELTQNREPKDRTWRRTTSRSARR